MGLENAYTKSPAEALRHFQVEEQKGLSAEQVKSAREKHGRNGMFSFFFSRGHQTTANQEQRCQKTRPHPSGSSSSSNSRISWLSYCWAQQQYLSYLPSSNRKKAGLHL